METQIEEFHIQASIPESWNNIYALAGLLTYSPFTRSSRTPKANSDQLNGQMVMELTAAGQLRNYTVFPFNPGYSPETESTAKV